MPSSLWDSPFGSTHVVALLTFLTNAERRIRETMKAVIATLVGTLMAAESFVVPASIGRGELGDEGIATLSELKLFPVNSQ